ncbi:MAG: FkbM family methyltransferase [Verrucomicrobiaceae bacterium]|nr:FkbM family methyltransferase [Verrucomicrobiaceae bacterium]
MRFVVQPGMGGTFALGVDGYNHAFFADKITPGMQVLDVGANCGQMALLFSRLAGPQGRVVSLEPVPRNFAVLRRNLELNGCSNVSALALAGGRAAGKAQFLFDEAHHTQGGLAEYEGAVSPCQSKIEVTVDTLDHVAAETGLTPQLLKVDVEGGGGEVLAGAQELITRCRPRIFFEMHTATKECPEYRCLMELREKHRYHLHDLAGAVIEELQPCWGHPIWCMPV